MIHIEFSEDIVYGLPQTTTGKRDGTKWVEKGKEEIALPA